MTAISSEPEGRKFGEDSIEKGLQELAELYKHDYLQAMPEIRPLAGLNEAEVERLGRLGGVVLKRDLTQVVAIDPGQSNTGSHFAYVFDLPKLGSSEFARSETGKIYTALWEQTKSMMDEGVVPEISLQDIEMISALPPDQRAGAFAERLASEGRTFRAILQAVRFVTCKPAIRSAFAAVVVAQAGTASSAAAVAGVLITYMPWAALYPPALVTAVVGLIIVMGVEGFCAWSGPYLAKFSQTQDMTTVGNHG